MHPIHVLSLHLLPLILHVLLHLLPVEDTHLLHTVVVQVAVHVCQAGALPLCAPVALVTPLTLLVIIAILAS